MTSRAEEAFIALADHCMGCAQCKPDLDAPRPKCWRCPTAEELYRTWRADWKQEHCQ